LLIANYGRIIQLGCRDLSQDSLFKDQFW
jgi:hypothetical protein